VSDFRLGSELSVSSPAVDWNEEYGHRASCEDVAHDRRAPHVEALRPAERDHVGAGVARDLEDVLVGHADARLQPHQLGVGTVPTQELVCPVLDLVLWLVAEERQGRGLVHVECDDVEL